MVDTSYRGNCLLAIILLLTSLAAATKLRCFIGEDICKRWRDNEAAEHGTFKGKVVCCPPENHQALLLNGFLPEPDNCQCEVGTAEKYAYIDRSGASALLVPGFPFVTVVMMVMWGFWEVIRILF